MPISGTPREHVDVRAECKRRFGRACVLIYGPDMETVVQELECRGNWCPALKRVIEESEDDDNGILHTPAAPS